MRLNRAIIIILNFSFPLIAPAHAQQAANGEPVFEVPRNIELETGDSWKQSGQRYRLYGVQSCLRGTSATMPDGKTTDCGNISLAHLAGLLSTAKVSCQPIAKAHDNAMFVVCGAEVNSETIDVGTALISTGYAFAATDTKGNAVNSNYLVAELDAKMKQEGLWKAKFSHPVSILLKQTKN